MAITTGKHLGTTLALLGIDAKDGHWSVSNDGHMYRIYSRLGKQMKPAARKGKTS